jgi:hypothetical protein
MAAAAALIVLLIRVRLYRTFPAFFVYVCWDLFSDAVLLVVQIRFPSAYFNFYLGQLVIDSAMMFAVLVELAWSVLLPIRSSLPKRSWIAIAALIALVGLLLWPVAGLTLPTSKLTAAGLNFFRLEQTIAILRVVVFLGMTAFSQLLAIGWRNRELQVATGLGFYSIVSLGISILHTHQAVSLQWYHWMDEVGAVSYLGTLAYWVFAFTTKEVERREFSPQVQNFLLLVGGTAKASRVAVADFAVSKPRPKDRQ